MRTHISIHTQTMAGPHGFLASVTCDLPLPTECSPIRMSSITCDIPRQALTRGRASGLPDSELSVFKTMKLSKMFYFINLPDLPVATENEQRYIPKSFLRTAPLDRHSHILFGLIHLSLVQALKLSATSSGMFPGLSAGFSHLGCSQWFWIFST